MNINELRIPIGTRYITKYSGTVPHDNCHKKCMICLLWFGGWRVHIFRFLWFKFLVWESNGLQIKYND